MRPGSTSGCPRTAVAGAPDRPCSPPPKTGPEPRATLVVAEVESPAPSGRAFFEARGYAAGLVALSNPVLLDDVDRSLLEAWVADPDPAYDLVLIDGRSPEHLVQPQLEALAGINDAPLRDIEVEDEVFTADGLAAVEKVVAALGQRRCTYLAIHRATGQGAGFTTVRWDPGEPAVLWQRGTAVSRAHRGHRLGRRLKAAMLLHLLATVPGAREVRPRTPGPTSTCSPSTTPSASPPGPSRCCCRSASESGLPRSVRFGPWVAGWW